MRTFLPNERRALYAFLVLVAIIAIVVAYSYFSGTWDQPPQ
jgi:hypothetical protein